MKKVLLAATLLLGFSSAAFAEHTNAISTGSTVVPAGTEVYGSQTAPTPLVKLSTGVRGAANYNQAAYSIFTKHDNGSKVFGTANDSTSVYWKASGTGALNYTTNSLGTTSGSGNFSSGWTTY